MSIPSIVRTGNDISGGAELSGKSAEAVAKTVRGQWFVAPQSCRDALRDSVTTLGTSTRRSVLAHVLSDAERMQNFSRKSSNVTEGLSLQAFADYAVNEAHFLYPLDALDSIGARRRIAVAGVVMKMVGQARKFGSRDGREIAFKASVDVLELLRINKPGSAVDNDALAAITTAHAQVRSVVESGAAASFSAKRLTAA